MSLCSDLDGDLKRLAERGLLRTRRVLQSPQRAHVKVDGKNYISFASNDYLGLADHPRLIEAAREGAELWGVGSGASHLVCGHHAAHEALEDALAKFVSTPRALLFSTGYMANIGIITALMGRGDAVFADRLNHASLNDAVVLSRADFNRYPHRDVEALDRLLAQSHAKRKLIASDAVFSMDGDIAPVQSLVELAERHDAWLLLDDAHGFGVLGAQGCGTLSHFQVRSPRIINMATLGKAGGVFGAFAAAENDVVETLIQRARTYIYTTATPPMLAHALLESLDLIRVEEWRRLKLIGLIRQFKSGLRMRKFRLLLSDTAIQPIVIGGNADVIAASAALLKDGILVPAIRPPSVPKGEARLRVSLSAAHSSDDVERLVGSLHGVEH
ncbi:MAG: 8-amino-7-oxononanoate synthase [Burkholderiales bacterium]